MKTSRQTTTPRPAVPAPMQVVGITSTGRAVIHVFDDYYPEGDERRGGLYHVEADRAGGFSIYRVVDVTGRSPDVDVTVEVSEEDAQLAFDLIDLAGLALLPNPASWLAHTLLPLRVESDRLDA